MNYFNIEITPILTLSENNAICNILKIDGITMMFDSGYDEIFNEEITKIYTEKINYKIDYIFLSDNTINNIGGLPFLMKNDNFKDAKIYATVPVAKLGFYIIVDAYISKIENNQNFNLFSEMDISKCFLNINEVKYKENIKLPHKSTEIILTALPSGNSLGGSCWKINYKLQTILYAPHFSINFKYICDPFPYEFLKNVNVLITDTKFSKKVPIVKTIIENEFKNKILEEMEKGRNILIPSDTANLNMEILIRLEKILDEFYSRGGPYEGNLVNLGNVPIQHYKVLVCGYSSYEIVESLKSLIEFLGSSISQQFYSYNENPFNLKYVQCVSDIEEYHEIKINSKNNFIIISSFESLESGINVKLLPEILNDINFKVFLIGKSYKNSLLRKLFKKVNDGIKIFEFEEVKRIKIIEDSIDNINEKNKEINIIEDTQTLISIYETNLKNKNAFNNFGSKHSDLSIKKKLFAKSPYPMFAYHQKKKLNEYGIELTEKEIKLMKSSSEEKAEVFESSFKTFLYTNNKNQDQFKNELRLKIKRSDLFSGAKYKYVKNKINIQLLAKFVFYDLFDSDGIDQISKEIIIKEINPKDYILFLGKSYTNNFYSNNKIIFVNTNSTEILKIKDNLINLKFDSSVLNNLPSIFIKDFGFVYDIKNTFLKIKTKRKEIKEVSIIDKTENVNKDNLKIIMDKEDFLDCFYTKSDFKLINLKREIAKVLNQDLFIFKNYITNANADFKLFLKNNELVLEGNLNQAYLKIRNCIYTNFINLDEI